jgi:cysteine-rich repeat protein
MRKNKLNNVFTKNLLGVSNIKKYFGIRLFVNLFVLSVFTVLLVGLVAGDSFAPGCSSRNVGQVKCNLCTSFCEDGEYYLEKCTAGSFGSYSWELYSNRRPRGQECDPDETVCRNSTHYSFCQQYQSNCYKLSSTNQSSTGDCDIYDTNCRDFIDKNYDCWGCTGTGCNPYRCNTFTDKAKCISCGLGKVCDGNGGCVDLALVTKSPAVGCPPTITDSSLHVNITGYRFLYDNSASNYPPCASTSCRYPHKSSLNGQDFRWSNVYNMYLTNDSPRDGIDHSVQFRSPNWYLCDIPTPGCGFFVLGSAPNGFDKANVEENCGPQCRGEEGSFWPIVNGCEDGWHDCNNDLRTDGCECPPPRSCINNICVNCGDGNIEPGEECGEPGLTCTSPSSRCNNCICVECGDGNIDPGEECGEPGLTCTAPSSRCNNCICVVDTCGNGVLDPGETCDDGNRDNDDGCSSLCQVEPGWGCEQSPSLCYELCLGTVESCGVYEPCNNCSKTLSRGCVGNILIEPWCNPIFHQCSLRNLDCSNCACECGDYGKPNEIGFCDDGLDNNCNNEWDYDTLDRGTPGNVPTKGDKSCNITITKINITGGFSI